ncbi:MAG: hypothetical protein WC757_02895 [Candidatus Paceibacterota bacterium]|jgi:phosphomannomutase
MNYLKDYTDFLSKTLHLTRPLKVVVDTSNGTTILPAREVFNTPLLTTVFINDKIDPDFSAHGPNPAQGNACYELATKVVAEKADLGIIFDGDGDRAFFVDERGKVLSAMATLYILSAGLKPPFVCDELVYNSLKHSGTIPVEKIIPSRVGSYYMKAELLKHGASIGAETSGHYYFSDFFGCDSGLFTATTLLSILSKSEKKLSELYTPLEFYTTAAEKVSFDIQRWNEAEEIIKRYAKINSYQITSRDGVTADAGEIWFNVRSSNTEPILRVTVGGFAVDSTHPIFAEIKKELAKIAEK